MGRTIQFLYRIFSIRSFLFLIGLVFILNPDSKNLFPQVDHYLFKVGTRLSSLPSQKHDIALVYADEKDINQLIHAPEKALSIVSWLRLQNLQESTIVLVLNGIPNFEASTLEERSLSISKDLSKYYENKKWLLNNIKSGNILLGLHNGESDRFYNKTHLRGELAYDTNLHALHNEIFRSLNPSYTTLSEKRPADAISNAVPYFLVDDSMTPEHALIIGSNNNDRFFHTIEFEILKNQKNYGDLMWTGDGIKYKKKGKDGFLSTGMDGKTYPAYSKASLKDSPVTLLEFGKIKNKKLKNKFIFLASSDNTVASNVSGNLLSLQTDAYYFEPIWSNAALKLLMSAGLIYILVLLPKLSILIGAICTTVIVLSIIIFSIAWQIINWQILPFGNVVLLLTFGHLFMMLWLKNYDELLDLQGELHDAKLLLAESLFKQNKLEDSRKQLLRCANDEAVNELLYNIASEQERKRQYHQAAETYEEIFVRKPSYRDVKKKRKAIAQLKGETTAIASPRPASDTVVLGDANVEKPVLGRYQIEKEIGRGAMGVVYLGYDPHISRQVAIKTLNFAQFPAEDAEQLKMRFFKEAEAAGRLDHPNIVRVHDIGEEPDLAFIAMEYIEGHPLSAHIKSNRLLPVETVFSIVADVAEALEYAHQHKVIHRDIKPSNILYNEDTEIVKVTDFGIARLSDNTSTRTGEILGSPLYMSPEQLKGEKLDATSDIYSLGISMFQLLSGELPFNGESLANLTYEILNNKHPNIREIREDLPTSTTRIINKALQKDSSKRFQSAGELALVIQKSLDRDF